MQNGEYSRHSSSLILCERGDRYSPAIMQRWTPLGFRSDTYNRNNGRRKKPPALPKYGTKSAYKKHEVTLVHQGKISERHLWSAYDNKLYRTFGLDEAYNTFRIADYVRYKLGLGPAAKAQAMNRAREDVMSSKAQLAVDLVELTKTKDMVAKAGMDLYQAFRDLRRGRPFSKLREEMKRDGFSSYAGNKWLEFIYGWAPTVSSAYEVADVLAEKWQNGSVITGKVKAHIDKEDVLPLTEFYLDGEIAATCRTTCKVFYQYTIVDKKLVTLSQLGFTNPAAIVWELLPWSFVIDWFVDVGGYINRMDYALGIGDVWSQSQLHWRVMASVKQRSMPNLSTKLNAGDPHSFVIHQQVLDREVPTNGLTNTFRGLKPFTNESVRLTSAVALLNQQRVRLRA